MTGAHPHRRRQSAAGFTFLEVLVVILIIGVIISFAALSINRADYSVEEETQRLAALIKLGSLEAVLQGREFALEFVADRYAFVVFAVEQWQPLADDDILRPRTLPFDVVVDLKLEGDQLALATPPPADGMEKRERQVPPRIFLLSSGEMSPFELSVHKTGVGGGYRLTGGSRGELKMSGPDDVSCARFHFDRNSGGARHPRHRRRRDSVRRER